MDWYIDACSLLNLISSGRFQEIGQKLNITFRVVPKVFFEESLYIYEQRGNIRGKKLPLDLKQYTADRILNLEPGLTEEEVSAFLNYAPFLDDGEAMTIAAAQYRKGGVITDDFRAWRFLNNEVPELPKLTSFSLINLWC